MSITIDPSAPSLPNQPAAPSGLRPRRTLNRLALALTGVAFGALGQYCFSKLSLWDGLLFYLVAVILFTRALAASQTNFSGTSAPYNLNLRGGWWNIVGVWLILLAVGASFIALNGFNQPDTARLAWWFYLISLGLLVGGVLLLARGAPWRDEARRLCPNRDTLIALGIVLALALLMRVYNLRVQPFGIWFDEAEAGLQARRMLQEPLYRPILYPPINISGHLLTLYALALKELGDNIYAMRLVSVVFGCGGVLAAYLFGAQWRSPRFGLALAFLMAIARWPVNFSRIAMTGIDTPFFEFLSLFFLTRLLQRGRLRDAVWAGLTLGFGLVFYTAFRLYLVALVVFGVIAGVWGWRRLLNWLRQDGWTAHLARLLGLLVTIWLVTMPLIKFALDNPNGFWYRTQQISIFNKRDQADLGQALGLSAAQHLLMFNYEGDKNGRHNLPGLPMLDPALAVLFVLGLGLALARPRNPANGFFLLLLPIALAGGIFSVDFEAPQALRSIAVIPAVIYFGALALAALGHEAAESLKPLPYLWRLVPAALLAGFMLVANAYVYFVRQANNFASWNAFSSPETIIGLKMAELGPDYTYFMSPFLAAHPTLDFLAPQVTQRHPLLLPDALPLRLPADRPVVLFIHPDDDWLLDEIARLYPNAVVYSALGRDEEADGPPVVYIAQLQPADLAAIQGLDLTYRPGDSLTADPPPNQPPLQVERALTLNANWPADSPIADGFVAEWQGVLYAPGYGLYNLRLVTPGPAQLEIDGYQVLAGQGAQRAGLALAQGNHSLRLRAAAAPGPIGLYWQTPGQPETLVPQWALYAPPVANHGLLGKFYPNDNWQGQPMLQRIDPFLNTYFHFIPMQRPYTVEWSGWLDAPESGIYHLGLRAVSEAQLSLDGRAIFATTAPDQPTEAVITLTQGLHDMVVRYKDSADRSRIHLTWARPNGEKGPIPAAYLWPPLGRPPEQPQPPPKVEAQPLRLQWLTSLGGSLGAASQFLEPRDVAVQSNGHVVVADTGNRWVQLLDAQGNFIQGLTGDDTPFEEPTAVGVNRKDEIFVLDSTLQWIYHYDAAGNFINRLGGPTAYFFHPRGLTVFADDTLGIADTGSARVALFKADGTLNGSLGQLGSGPGQFNEPTDVLRDGQGGYFVAEAENSRIQHLAANGVALKQWAIPPAYAYNGPHLAFGPDDTLFVTESQSHSLLRYAPDGRLLDQWQTIGPVALAAPVGVYYDSTSARLYLTDVETHQVHVFAVEVSPK